MPERSEEPLFVSERHALYVGWVLGVGMRHGIPLVPVVDFDGNYTDRVTYTTPGNSVITFIVPPPPEDWSFDDG